MTAPSSPSASSASPAGAASVGAGHLGRKLATGRVAALSSSAFSPGAYRVAANGQVEGLVRRAVVAPSTASSRPAGAGRRLGARPGDLLADPRRSRPRARAAEMGHRAPAAHLRIRQGAGVRQPAQIDAIRSQIDQAEAQINLIDEQLARTKLTAPFDGLVVSGDLSQSIGAAVQRGEVLFEIAPLEDYRVILESTNARSATSQSGQRGDWSSPRCRTSPCRSWSRRSRRLPRSHATAQRFPGRRPADATPSGCGPAWRASARSTSAGVAWPGSGRTRRSTGRASRCGNGCRERDA